MPDGWQWLRVSDDIDDPDAGRLVPGRPVDTPDGVAWEISPFWFRCGKPISIREFADDQVTIVQDAKLHPLRVHGTEVAK